MTDKQKTDIMRMRSRGASYQDISEQLGLSRNTVKSYCRRIELPKPEEIPSAASDICRQCGKPVTQSEKIKRRIFCCKSCREKWWAKHPDRINKKAVYSFKCACCGHNFTAYGNSRRKYCSHQCYISARFGGAAHGQTAVSG